MELPRYKCHKIVRAAKILWISGNFAHIRMHFEKPYDPFVVRRQWWIEKNAQVGGYYVIYDYGYASFSPAKAFEEGYTRIE